MSNILINKSRFDGRITLPPSKSLVHRAVIMAALADGVSRVAPVVYSDDINATIDAVTALGAQVIKNGDALEIHGIGSVNFGATIDCIESGSTLRFMMPVAAALNSNSEFVGRGRLPARPLDDFADIFPSHGVSMSADRLPLRLDGQLMPGKYIVSGHVSSQYISGLLMALSLLAGDSVIDLSSPLQSASYVDMTICVMKQFGVEVVKDDNSFHIRGGQKSRPCDFAVESDWSHAAFFLAAAAVDGHVELCGLYDNSSQPDSKALEIWGHMGANIQFDGNLVCSSNSLTGIEVDVGDTPDLVPAIAVCAAFAQGRTVIYNAARLRFKESDRLTAVATGLKALGARVTEGEDSLIIDGGTPLHGGVVDGFGDHRIVMAFAAAAIHIGGVEIQGAEAIDKSYPRFFEDFAALGGQFSVIDN